MKGVLEDEKNLSAKEKDREKRTWLQKENEDF